ncbi:TetR/AcrR family transcriptional regulator [Secundilactobacillus kimchicus]|uniref:TetR/AcrR family transcriptional regulator n=1 Tax=Secundilactobacillus kimchicus TaxID=528209 RepID=UPI0024A8F71A|nr:TetR/AcrR family transcriptional regulator [Secundilactobacillus kimchicus]
MPNYQQNSHNKSLKSDHPTHRRRGQELEQDILKATLNLVQETKYEDLTMDMIAKNAQTNKTVLYRRWSSKSDIVIAALRTQTTGLAEQLKQVPNTGSLAGDFHQLFAQINTLLATLHYENLFGLMRERLGGISIRDYFDKFLQQNWLSQMVRIFFKQAADRGEIDLDQIDESLYDLPAFLLLNRIYAPHSQAIDSAQLNHLIDAVLMPMYSAILKKK